MYARNADPELESLRQEVDGPPNLDTVALNIRKATGRIHAAYLFEHVGRTTLQKLCLSLSSTDTGKFYCGWQEFAAHLGLTMQQIRCIDYDFKGLQDPTYYALLAYVQRADATMDKILIALQWMSRLDVINEIKDCITELVYAIPQSATLDVLRPTNQPPRVPLVLCPVETLQREVAREQSSRNCISQDSPQQTKPSYGCIVMLTFGDDASESVQHIAEIFRSKSPKIGVVILQEQNTHVYSRAEEFVDDCFKQVNFIVPILTRDYIERINNPRRADVDVQNKLDTKYMRYIYALVRNEYVESQCVNNRVRCIVPDKEVPTVVLARLHPTFHAWFRESDIDAFVDNILLERYSK